MQSIAIEIRGILTQNMDFFNQVEVDDELLKGFLSSNKDVMQLIEPSPILTIRPKSHLLPFFMVTIIGCFVKDCKYHDWEICTANLETQPPVQQQSTTPDIAISQPIQHQSDSMSLDDIIENTMGGSEEICQKEAEETPTTTVITFNNVPPLLVTSLKSSNSKKPLKQPQNNQDKKKKQEHLTDNFNNSNLILTSYYSQQEEQAQLIRMYKKYLSARVRLIPNHACLKAYNRATF
ncbi:hypothetical protein RCL_jg6444.t1 [Rhizophagus clarus]|uniref:Uncharacterized protein n=1 Tax=Rhizophagus clarus TaxID=94130 RepID=A0A8H3LGJ4_9GLOM|nr:hypothetical protein RCL_jg6444.t1 [Rhizophagus clarus]